MSLVLTGVTKSSNERFFIIIPLNVIGIGVFKSHTGVVIKGKFTYFEKTNLILKKKCKFGKVCHAFDYTL